MTFDEVLKEPSDKEKILDYISKLAMEHPYKIYGNPDTYCDYNQGWIDALDRLYSFINYM